MSEELRQAYLELYAIQEETLKRQQHTLLELLSLFENSLLEKAPQEHKDELRKHFATLVQDIDGLTLLHDLTKHEASKPSTVPR